MRRKAWLAVLLSIGATTVAELTLVSTAEAGNNDSVLIGKIRDPETKEGIEGARVTVTGDKLQGERSMTTGKTGLYRLPDLPAGTYNVVIVYGETRANRSITLTANTTARLNVDLRMAGEVREIVIESAPVNTRDSNQGGSIDSEMSKRVPLGAPTGKGGANRSFESVSIAVPTASADLYGTSIAGTTSPENKYYVDGLSVSDPGFGLIGTGLTVEFLEEVRVETGGYMPEYGRSTGGILNAVTKTGSNEFHGGVWLYYTPGQLEGYRKAPQREGATIQAERQLLWLGDAGFDIGGRLIKDKLWFYGGVSIAHQRYDIKTSWNRLVIDDATGAPIIDPDTEFNVTERIPGSVLHRTAQGTTVQALAKLTYSPASNHTLHLLGIYAPGFSGGNGTFGLIGSTGGTEGGTGLGTYDALGHKFNDSSADVQLEWNALADDNRWDISTVIGWHHQVNVRGASDGSKIGTTEGLSGISGVVYRQNNPDFHSATDFIDLPPGVSSDACDPWVDPNDPTLTTQVCPATVFSSSGPGFLYDRRFDRLQARSNAERLVEAAGSHEIKFGIDFEYMQYNSTRAYSGGRLYRESTRGSYFSDYRRYGYLTGPDQIVQLDTLQWRTFTTTIGGFVQDSWAIMDKVTLNAGLRYDAQSLYGGDGKLSMVLPNQVSPRVGLVWDPTQEGKAKLFGNYARSYQSIPLNLMDRAGSGEPGVGQLYDAGGCDPTDPANMCADAAFPIAGPLDTDRYSYAFGAGKTAIDPALKPQSTDEVVAGGEYEIFPGSRLGLTYQRRWFNRIIEDMSRDEATTYFIGNPGYGIAKDFPKGRRIYDAVVVYLDKRFTKNWLLSANYTMSWLRGNVAGLFRPETGQLDPGINSDFDLASLLSNRFGALPGDQRHAVKVFSAGEIPLGRSQALMVGGAFRASSGGPTSLLGSHELYGPGESFLVQRGAGDRLPWVFSVDTNFGYRTYFNNNKMMLAITMDVFNIANFQAVTAVDENYTFSDVIPIEGGSLEDLQTHTDTAGDPIVQNPNFGKPTAFQVPRQFRFGVRLSF